MKKPRTYSDSKQTMWEMWFVASVIIVIAYLFTGMLGYSITIFPNWYIFAGASVLNLLVCLHVGCRKNY